MIRPKYRALAAKKITGIKARGIDTVSDGA
jgi:hypothetical protein